MQFYLDPTGELNYTFREPLKKLEFRQGVTLGLLDISKAKGNVFLDKLEEMFRAENIKIKRFKKTTFARPASLALVQEIAATVDVVIEGLAD